MTDQHNLRVRLTNTIFVTESLFSAGQIAIITLLAIMAVQLSNRESLAGVPSTTLTIVQAATAIPLGLLMARYGRRPGLILAYMLGAIGAMLGVFAIVRSSFVLLMISSGLIGMGRAGSQQSRFAAGDMFFAHDRGKMIGRVVFAGTVGAIFGPLLVAPSGRLATLLGIPEFTDAGPWILACGLLIIGALITLTTLTPDPLELAVVDKKEDETQDNSGRSVRELLSDPKVQLAALSMLVSQLVMVALMTITPVHMINHALGKGAVSVVISAHTLGMFAFSPLTGILIARHGINRVMLWGAGMLVLSAIVAPLAAAMPFLIIGLFLLGLGWNFCFIAGSTLLSEGLNRAERGRIQGTTDMMVAAAAALGSFSSGFVYGVGDYVLVAGMSIVFTALFLFIMRILRSQIAATATPIAIGD